MLRLADGDRTAVDVVYRILWPMVVRYCQRLVGGSSDAEDLAQAALIKLFAQAHNYEPDKRPEAWALTIAAWECRSYHRKRSRMERNLEKMQALPREQAPDTAEAAWKGQAMSALEQLVRDMSQRDRQVLVDSFVNELAEPVHRKRKQRMLSRLRRRWKEVYGEE